MGVHPTAMAAQELARASVRATRNLVGPRARGGQWELGKNLEEASAFRFEHRGLGKAAESAVGPASEREPPKQAEVAGDWHAPSTSGEDLREWWDAEL